MVIGIFVFGIFAKFAAPLGYPGGEKYVPVIPGPDTKNPKTSLYEEQGKEGHSLDANTNFLLCRMASWNGWCSNMRRRSNITNT